MAIVKCIEIDPFTETVRYVQKEVPDHWDDFHGPREPHPNGTMISRPNRKGNMLHPHLDSTSKRFYCLYYQDMDPKDEMAVQDRGFMYLTSDFSTEAELEEAKGNWYSSRFIAVGKAWVIAWDEEKRHDKKIPSPGKTVDIDLPLDYFQKRIAEWTNGIFNMVPEFTCMLSEKFDEPGVYEILLRLENKDALSEFYETKFTKPLQHVNSQIITFEFDWQELTIITGKIPSDSNAKIRVAIFRTDTLELKQLDACTMAAHKVPIWIKRTLERHFEWTYVWSKVPDKLRAVQAPNTQTEESI